MKNSSKNNFPVKNGNQYKKNSDPNSNSNFFSKNSNSSKKNNRFFRNSVKNNTNFSEGDKNKSDFSSLRRQPIAKSNLDLSKKTPDIHKDIANRKNFDDGIWGTHSVFEALNNQRAIRAK